MTPSAEYIALTKLRAPDRSRPGDMWLCRRLGIVRVMNGHKRGSRRGDMHNGFHLYHWGKLELWSSAAAWRDNDPNAGLDDPTLMRRDREMWEYIGNIGDLLPYAELAGKPYSRADL